MVGRAAMFLGNAVVDGIEGTAELVQNAAKKADKIAMNVARCVRRRDAPPLSLFFFAPVPSPRISPRLTLHLSSPRSPDGTPRGHASRARGADAWADFGDEKENATANAPSHRSREASAVGCSRRSRTSPRVRDARAPAVPRRPPNAPPRTPRVRPRVKIPPRGRPGRGRRARVFVFVVVFVVVGGEVARID